MKYLFFFMAAMLWAEPFDAVVRRLAGSNTHAFLVRRDGRVVREWYAEGVTADKKQGTASLAKALIGGNSLMLAMEDGRIRPEDAASKFIAQWKDDDRRGKITIRHLATHTSGIQDANEDGVPHEKLAGWMGEFWRRSPSPFQLALKAPVLFAPGSAYHYSNPGMAMLAYAVAVSHGQDQKEILRTRVMQPLGIADGEWSLSYNEKFSDGGLTLYANWGGAAFTPRAAAAIGEWMMTRGGEAKTMVRYAGMPLPDRGKDKYAPASGLCWYTNTDGVWPKVPRDAFVGAGAGHEVMLVAPSLKLVAVRNGRALNGKPFWTAVYEDFFAPLMEEIAPYPASDVIRGVDFAPVETVTRKAIDSDNWPLTWGDDNAMYTVYGDGTGFEPGVEEKLSMGFARIKGSPLVYEAENIRSETGERKGDGAKGLKASGLLMVDQVLYMWVRNAANSELWSSADRAVTWKQHFRWKESFGSPVFLNFGKNYEGARDGYVYVYSQDGGSAYKPDDGIVLARVLRGKVTDQRAYEFWAGDGKWTRDIGKRQPVFRFAGHCERTDAVYHAGLKRYLLAVSYGHDGGWGIYDAPEPWGPWTTAFHTPEWDLGKTHGYRLPAKWMQGLNLYLVFSGARGKGMHYDAFSVRRMRLRVE
ncbi:MAG: serine hydrolase [Bryobacterales bacterium]|nr:serine hydrolase [Bryobacterales bacterium]